MVTEELANTENILPVEVMLEENTIIESICLNTILVILVRKELEFSEFTRIENIALLLISIKFGTWFLNRLEKST